MVTVPNNPSSGYLCSECNSAGWCSIVTSTGYFRLCEICALKLAKELWDSLSNRGSKFEPISK